MSLAAFLGSPRRMRRWIARVGLHNGRRGARRVPPHPPFDMPVMLPADQVRYLPRLA